MSWPGPLAYVVLLAGLPAIPFLDDLVEEWEKFFGTPVRSNMRKTLRETGGPVLEKMGMAGIPALMEIDITGSLKTGIPGIGAGTPQDTIRGVYGGLARKGIKAMSAAEREDYFRALKFAPPAFIEAVLKAYRLTETGDHAQGEILDRRGGEAGPPGGGRGGGQAGGVQAGDPGQGRGRA